MRIYFITSTALVYVTLLANNVSAQDFSTDIFYNDESGSALGCYVEECESWYHFLADVPNCKTKRHYCYYSAGASVAVTSCDTCEAGYNRVWATSNVGDCSPQKEYDIDAQGSNTQYGYMKCTCDASLCADVGAWANYNTKFQRRAKYTCQSGSCKATSNYEYRCAAGFYGASTNGTSGCSQCPAIDDKMSTKTYGTSVPGSNAAISSCFLAPGTYNDTTGTFKITGGNCNY